MKNLPTRARSYYLDIRAGKSYVNSATSARALYAIGDLPMLCNIALLPQPQPIVLIGFVNPKRSSTCKDYSPRPWSPSNEPRFSRMPNGNVMASKVHINGAGFRVHGTRLSKHSKVSEESGFSCSCWLFTLQRHSVVHSFGGAIGSRLAHWKQTKMNLLSISIEIQDTELLRQWESCDIFQ